MSTPDLDEIQRRLPDIPESAMSRAERDRAHLLAYARDLEARIGRVEALIEANDLEGVLVVNSDKVRAALTVTDAS